MKKTIHALSIKCHDYLKDIRRYLHTHPELSFHEEKTAKYLVDILQKHQIIFEDNVGGYGIIAKIEGRNPHKKTIGLRGDMDALPIQEENEVPYKSINQGIMHACGHDVHTTCLLGALLILNELKDEFEGTILCVFQPAEEKLPGGASLMLKSGKLPFKEMASMVGQHVYPSLEVGKVGFRSGMYMASADELYFTIKGKGGHGAMPQECIDPILVAAHFITNLQTITSRYATPDIPTVLTIGKINSKGGATNIIPDEVYLEGTLRTMNEPWRDEIHQHIIRIADHTAATFGGEISSRIEVGYPCLINEPELTSKCKSWAQEYLGSENVIELPLRMTAEDFAYYTQVMDACFYRLGTGNIQKNITAPIHTSRFDIDEDALITGAGLMAYLGFKQLS